MRSIILIQILLYVVGTVHPKRSKILKNPASFHLLIIPNVPLHLTRIQNTNKRTHFYVTVMTTLPSLSSRIRLRFTTPNEVDNSLIPYDDITINPSSSTPPIISALGLSPCTMQYIMIMIMEMDNSNNNNIVQVWNSCPSAQTKQLFLPLHLLENMQLIQSKFMHTLFVFRLDITTSIGYSK